MAGARLTLLWLASALLVLSGARDETCTDPIISPSYYTISDAVISSETVFVVEISLTCKDGAQDVALYADLNGKQFPVTRGQDIGRYQDVGRYHVSWSMEHKLSCSGTYEVKFFDEESYSILCKAQQNNIDVFSVNIDHRGAWSELWVSTEVLAALVGLLVYYMAFSAKSNIQA